MCLSRPKPLEQDKTAADTYTPNTYVYRAATLGALGDTAAAKRAVADATSRLPDISIETFAADQSSNPSEHDRLVETMRAAGFPACASPAALSAEPDLPRLPECATS